MVKRFAQRPRTLAKRGVRPPCADLRETFALHAAGWHGRVSWGDGGHDSRGL